MAELTGAQSRQDGDGISIVPTLLGMGEQKQHRYLYWEDPKSSAIREGEWKAISPRKSAPFEIYDLANDLEEQHDLAHKEPEILDRLKKLEGKARTPPKIGRIMDPSKAFRPGD